MFKLIFVTLVWAFSFSLIGEYLAGKVDSYYIAFLRVFIAFLTFLYFMIKKYDKKYKSQYIKAGLVGAIQIGLMYLFYYNSFAYLSVVEMSLFTVTTPFYVTMFYDLISKRIRPFYLVSVGVSVLAAVVVKYGSIGNSFWIGFFLVQMANLCFGVGQSYYKFVFEKTDFKHQQNLFGYFFVGASIVTGIATLCFGNFDKMAMTNLQWGVVVYLAVIASSLSYFLWNKGACEVDSGVLAIMNNALIPAAIIVNLVFWNKSTDYLKLFLGSIILYLSLFIHKKIIKYYDKKK